MSATLASKGQGTIPKQIRNALNRLPGCQVDLAVNREGGVVIHKVDAQPSRQPDRFESARGKADIKWRTDELMALLRGEDRCCWSMPMCWLTFWRTIPHGQTG